jgi:hypothetical protein
MTAGRKSPVSRASSGTVSPVGCQSKGAANQAADQRIKTLEKALLEANLKVQILEKKVAAAAPREKLDGKDHTNQVISAVQLLSTCTVLCNF